MGGLDRIHNSACPFCRVISFAINEENRLIPQRNPGRRKEVELIWFDRVGPALGAFVIQGFSCAEICFVRAESMDSSMDSAYCLGERIDKQLDLRRVLDWILECCTTHGEDCNIAVHRQDSIANNYAGLKLLRLVDVEKQCIIETQKPCRYAALSYVWGNVGNFRLTKANKPGLMELGALSRYGRGLPKTIQDAIDLVRGLGERYLWVDSLCLEQNDPGDLESGVNAMDLIYENALVTIVAACGHNANAGLPGIQYGSRTPEICVEEVIAGVKLGVLLNLDALMKTVPYTTRGWTYVPSTSSPLTEPPGLLNIYRFQEEVLSRRILYFVDNKVYFRCRSATIPEACHRYNDRLQLRPGVSFASFLPATVHLRLPLGDFGIMLDYYSLRTFSDQSDALRAMAGIIRRVSAMMMCRFLEGLPTAAFDNALLFRRQGMMLHRRAGFPSYSWAGWKGQLHIPFMTPDRINDWLAENTWIVWYRRSANGVVNPVWDILANESFPFDNPKFAGYRKRQPFQPLVSLPFPTSRTLPSESLALACEIPSYQILQFWTLAAFYRITCNEPVDALAAIVDRNNIRCGSLYLDGFEELAFFESTAVFEVIILSECTIKDWRTGSQGIDFHFVYGFYGLGHDKFYNVMLLEWSKGLAERRGIGLLEQTAISRGLSPGPVWKEIILG
jgi:hypothetical protein